MAEIESLRAGGSPHSLRCPAGTNTHRRPTGVFEATLRKADKGSEVSDWRRPGRRNQVPLELSDGRAVLTEDYPGGPINGFDYAYSIFKDVIKFDRSPEALHRALGTRRTRLRFSDVDGPRRQVRLGPHLDQDR